MASIASRVTAAEPASSKPDDVPFRAYSSGGPMSPFGVTRLGSGATVVALDSAQPALVKLRPDGTIAWSYRYDVVFRPRWMTSVGESAYLAGYGTLDRTSEGERTEFRIIAFADDGTPRAYRTITTPNIAHMIGFGSTHDAELWLAVRRGATTTLLVLDRDGKPLRQMGFRSPYPFKIESFAALDDGAFAFSGTDGTSCLAGLLSAKGVVEWVKSLGGAEGPCLHAAASGDRIALAAATRDPFGWRLLLLARDGKMVADHALGPTMPMVEFVVGGMSGSFLASGRTLAANRIQLVSVNRSGALDGQWSLPEPMVPNPIFASGSSGGKRSLIFTLDQTRWAFFELDGGLIGQVPKQFEQSDARWAPVGTIEKSLGLSAFDDVFTSQLLPRPAASVFAIVATDNAFAAAPLPMQSGDTSTEPQIPLGPFEPPDAVVDDDQEKRGEFASLFKNRSWKVLDSRLDRAVVTRERTTTGAWTVYLAHEALTFATAELSGVAEEQYFAALDEWLAAVPASHHPRILRAQSWDAIAWSHRGPGFSSTVTDEAWTLWRQYGERALEEIRALEKLNPVSPMFFQTHLDLLGAHSMDETAVFERGMRAEPRFHYLYMTRLSYLRPQWGGTREDVSQFLKLVHSTLAADDLEQVWSRIIYDTTRITPGHLSPSDVDEKLAVRSLERIREAFPTSRQAAYRRAGLTCRMNWKDAARKAFSDPILKFESEMAGRYIGSPIRYANCRTWALSPDPAPPVKDAGWQASLFENEVNFADGRRATGFRSFLTRNGEKVVAVTAVAPLLDPAQAKGPRKLGAFKSWTMRSNAARVETLTVTAAKTGSGGLLPSEAVLLDVNGSTASARAALVPADANPETWSSVWIVARYGDGPVTAHFGLVVGHGSDRFQVDPVYLVPGPQLSGSPVIDAKGKLVGTVIGVDGDGRVQCERYGTTRGRSTPTPTPPSTSSGPSPELQAMMANVKPYVTRKGTQEPFPAEWTVAGKQQLAADNTQAFDEEIAKYGETIKPGVRMYRILIGVGVVQTLRTLDYSIPMKALGKTSLLLWDFKFPEGTNGSYDVAISADRRVTIIPPLEGGP